jgi:hypothetical protein
MYKYFLLLFTLSILRPDKMKSCNQVNNKQIRSVQINSGGSITGDIHLDSLFTTWVHIYYRDNFILYEYPFSYDSSLSNWEITERKELLNEERLYYFIYNKDSSSGIKYEQQSTQNNLPVDSMLTVMGVGERGLDSFSQVKPDSSFANKKAGTLKEVFRHKGTKGTVDNFTISLYYSKNLNDIPASFSSTLDKAKKMKLVQIEILFDQASMEAQEKKISKRDYRVQMVRYQPKDLDVINAFFDRYAKEVKQ